MQAQTFFTERQVRECARELCILINLAHQKKVFEPIFKKYQMAKYLRVAQVPVRIREEAYSHQRSQGLDGARNQGGDVESTVASKLDREMS